MEGRLEDVGTYSELDPLFAALLPATLQRERYESLVDVEGSLNQTFGERTK